MGEQVPSNDLLSRLTGRSGPGDDPDLLADAKAEIERLSSVEDNLTLACENHMDEIQKLRRREYVMAQHDETGRYWSGPREDIPARFAEVPERAEGGLVRAVSDSSDTPRTDAAQGAWELDGERWVLASFAKQLEREYALAVEEIRRLRAENAMSAQPPGDDPADVIVSRGDSG